MFEELLKLVGDNAEAKAAIAAIESKITTANQQSEAKIESLTSQFEAIKQEKEKYKTGNKLVKEALGLDQINDETISSRLKELGASGSAKELARKLSEKEAEIEQIKQESISQMNNFKIELEADKALNSVSEVLIDDPLLRNVFKQELQKSIGINEGQVLPMQQVGDQKIPIMKDGKPLGLVEYASELLNSDTYKSFQKPTTRNSAGHTGGGEGQSSRNFGGSEDERKAAVAEMIKRG